MSTTTAATRILTTAAAAGVALLTLTGCTLVSTLAGGGEETPPTTTSTEAATQEATESPGPGGETEETPTPEPTPAPTEEGQPVSLFDIKVGDCFDLPEGSQDAMLFSSCDVPHTYEVYAIVTLTNPEYPGDDEMGTIAFDECESRFQTFVGSTYATSSYSIYRITPSEQTWNEMNDREVACLLYLNSGEQAVGSAENSRR